MQFQNFSRQRGRFAAPIFLGLVFITSALADQSLELDWEHRAKGDQVCPAAVTGRTPVTLTIHGVNDIVYQYTFKFHRHQLPGETPPLTSLNTPVPPPPPGALPPSSCPAELMSARQAVTAMLAAPAFRPADKARSVPLSATIAAWNDNLSSINAILNASPADLEHCELKQMADKLRRMKKIVEGSHDLLFKFAVDSNEWWEFDTSEWSFSIGAEPELVDSISWKCGIEDTLTLSAGVLITSIPYRDYTHRKVPSATGVADQLVVDGVGSYSPVSVALFNYNLYTFNASPQIGFSLSTGPVFKLGGKADVSPFGWYSGISASLWRRLYITPGFHIGQFADYPAGFGNRSTIPDDFGELTPVRRWTTRFGIAITFRTNSLVKNAKAEDPKGAQ